jgi:hypothetical protein
MKKLTYQAILCLVLSLFSCQKDIPIEPLAEPVFLSHLPAFPLTHLYIINREYEMLNQDLQFNSREEYLEKRLIELFPQTAYRGMVQEAKIESQNYEQSYNLFTESLTHYSDLMQEVDSPLIDESVPAYISVEDDMNFTQLTAQEIEDLAAWDNIALAQFNKSQMDSLFTTTNRFWTNNTITIPIVIPITLAVKFSVFRIFQSMSRSYQQSEFYFPDELYSGYKGDAFRHVFMSMQLRRYLGRTASALVMMAYEQFNPNSRDSDKYMDLHNNKVGRGKKYWAFRGAYFKDRYNWERWAVNAKNFINNPKNGEDMPWEHGHLERCQSEADKVSSLKYIFYQ